MSISKFSFVFRNEDQSNSQEDETSIEMGPTSNEIQSQSLEKAAEDYSVEKTRTQRLNQRPSTTSTAVFRKLYIFVLEAAFSGNFM